jgi:phage terminase large subunit-like protein
LVAGRGKQTAESSRAARSRLFAYAHHGITFADRPDLEWFIKQRVLQQLQARMHNVEKADSKAYIDGRVAALDGEWRP